MSNAVVQFKKSNSICSGNCDICKCKSLTATAQKVRASNFQLSKYSKLQTLFNECQRSAWTGTQPIYMSTYALTRLSAPRHAGSNGKCKTATSVKQANNNSNKNNNEASALVACAANAMAASFTYVVYFCYRCMQTDKEYNELRPLLKQEGSTMSRTCIREWSQKIKRSSEQLNFNRKKVCNKINKNIACNMRVVCRLTVCAT